MKRPSQQAVAEQIPTETAVDTSNIGGEIPVVRWTNRRRMAWRAFYSLLIATFIYWFGLPLWFQWWALPTAWLEVIGESFFWFATTMAAVIISYMGFTTLPFWGKARGNKASQVEVYDEDY